MKYLQGSNISRDESYEDFSYSTKPAAILLAKDLIKRLFSPPINQQQFQTFWNQHQLRHHWRWICKAALNLCHLCVQQLALFELQTATGTWIPKLEKLLQAFLTIQPTSTCSERVLSVAVSLYNVECTSIFKILFH
jgi:hypothetical protein